MRGFLEDGCHNGEPGMIHRHFCWLEMFGCVRLLHVQAVIMHASVWPHRVLLCAAVWAPFSALPPCSCIFFLVRGFEALNISHVKTFTGLIFCTLSCLLSPACFRQVVWPCWADALQRGRGPGLCQSSLSMCCSSVFPQRSSSLVKKSMVKQAEGTVSPNFSLDV